MKQLALSHMFGVREEGPVDGMEVYDLFCGAGGFSAGATAAGYEGSRNGRGLSARHSQLLLILTTD